MARLGYVNPAEGDGEVVTSLPCDSVEDGIKEARRLHDERGWHTWVRDDGWVAVWDSDLDE